MKLDQLLKSYKLDAEQIKAISEQVDIIKASAVLRETTKYDKLSQDHDAVNKELATLKPKLKEYEVEKKDATIKEAFTKAGGNAEQYSNFKRVAGDLSDLDKYDFKKDLADFPSLKVKPTASTNTTNTTSAILNLSDTGTQEQAPQKEDTQVYM